MIGTLQKPGERGGRLSPRWTNSLERLRDIRGEEFSDSDRLPVRPGMTLNPPLVEAFHFRPFGLR